jgi:hypothetical protein
MKTISIAMIAAAMLFVASSSYACGNQTKADVKSSSAGISGNQGQMSTSACTSPAANTKASSSPMTGKGVGVMTAEYRKTLDSKSDNFKVNTIGGNCCSEMGTGVSTSCPYSGKATVKESTVKKNPNLTVLMGAADLTTIVAW